MVHYINQTVAVLIDESVTGTGNHFEFAFGCSFIVTNCTFGSVVDCSITGDNNTVKDGHGITMVGKRCTIDTGCGLLMGCEPTHPCEYLGDCRGVEFRRRAQKEYASRRPQRNGEEASSRPMPCTPESILAPILDKDLPRMADIAWVTRLQKEYTEKMFRNDPYGLDMSERRRVPATLDPLRTRRRVTGQVLHAVCYVCKDICPTLSLTPCLHRNLCPQCAYSSYQGKYRLLHCPQCKKEVTAVEFMAPELAVPPAGGSTLAAPAADPNCLMPPPPPAPPSLRRTHRLTADLYPNPGGRDESLAAQTPSPPQAAQQSTTPESKRVRFAPVSERGDGSAAHLV